MTDEAEGFVNCGRKPGVVAGLSKRCSNDQSQNGERNRSGEGPSRNRQTIAVRRFNCDRIAFDGRCTHFVALEIRSQWRPAKGARAFEFRPLIFVTLTSDL